MAIGSYIVSVSIAGVTEAEGEPPGDGGQGSRDEVQPALLGGEPPTTQHGLDGGQVSLDLG